MKTIIYGAYGAGNLGDDLILEAGLRRYEDIALIVCPGTPYVETQIPIVTPEQLLSSTSSWLRDETQLVFYGGSLFWSLEHIVTMLRVSVKAKLAGCKIVIDGIGADGAEANPGAVSDIIDLADEVSFRESSSLKLLYNLNIPTSRVARVDDPVLALPVNCRRAPKGPAKCVIAINWGDGRFLLDEAWRHHAITIFNSVLDMLPNTVELRYVLHVRHIASLKDDCLIKAEYFRILSGNRITTTQFPTLAYGLIDQYADCSAVVALRFHALVIAKLLGLPALALHIGEHSKYSGFAKDNSYEMVDLNDHSHLIAPKVVDFVNSVLTESRDYNHG